LERFSRRQFLQRVCPLRAHFFEDRSCVVNTVVAIPLAGPLPGAARIGRVAESRRRAGFIAGPENRFAHVALDDVLRGQPTLYSPLVLYGPAATGKTHLVVGLANWWRERRSGEGVVLLSGRQFVDQCAAASGIRQQDAWRKECRGGSLFVLDDLAPLAGRRAAQQDLCQTLDSLEESGGLVIVTCRSLPGQMSGLSPALVGRLSAGLATPLALPGAAARRAIVESLVAALRLPMSLEAAHLLADGMASSAPSLAKALSELEASIKADESQGCEIGMKAVQSLLSQGGGCEPPTLRSIAVQTAKYFRLTLADLKSPARRQALVLARGVAFVLIRELTDKSLEQIGAYFGGRDHTTVLHACRRTEKLAKRDATVQQAMSDLKRRLSLA
jgi:chromosomal replication initiator protein